ncbi:AMP-N domain-containing protein [Aphelenchoides besseyi]|nr:AMP-N domain-containing protein [Aphelenchoides besseyi]
MFFNQQGGRQSDKNRDEEEKQNYWAHDDRDDRRSSDRRTYDERPSRDYGRNYARSYGRDPNYSRQCSPPNRRSRSPPPRKRRSPDPPSNRIMLTSLPTHVDRDTMNIILSQQGFHPVDVRGVIQLEDGFEARVEFARENDSSYLNERKTFASTDWMCAKCSINNFNRRSSCFKCGTDRKESDALEEKGYNYVGSQPCDTILVRELPAIANEYDVIHAFSTYSNIPIQRVHISNSRKYCFVQLRSIEDACYVLTTFNRVTPHIQNCADPINSAALLAQNAIQMAQLGRIPDLHGRQSISTPLGVFQLYSKPDPRGFQQDPNSGYWYDSTSGFYYDPKTGFYFNNTTQQWCFWTTKFSTYIPVEGQEPELRKKLQLEERNLQIQEVGGESSQPKSAQDIQREMAKWAKKQEKIKLSFKKPDSEPAATVDPNAMKSWAEDEDPNSEEQETASGIRSTETASEVPIDSTSSDQKVKEFDPEDYLDRNQLACLLCQRQFKSSDILEKHCQKSELHKYLDISKPLAGGNVEDYEVEAKRRAHVPLDDTNVGNKLLKSMGWTEGRGLGRNEQGIVNPIAAEQRAQGVGLGAAGSRTGISRKERSLHSTIQRFNNILCATQVIKLKMSFWRGNNTLKVSAELFAQNRRRLFDALKEKKLPSGSVVLLQGGEESTRYNTDAEELAFRQESYFFWTFGVHEPGCFGLLELDSGKSVLFPPKTSHGFCHLEWMHSSRKLGTVIRDYLKSNNAKKLYLLKAENTDSSKVLAPADFNGINNFERDDELLYPVIAELRVFKTDLELEVLRYASKIASEAHREVMRRIQPTMYEYQMESLFHHISYYTGGCRHVAYTCIAARKVCGQESSQAIVLVVRMERFYIMVMLDHRTLVK